MRSESTNALGQPKLTKPTLGFFFTKVFNGEGDLERGLASFYPIPRTTTRRAALCGRGNQSDSPRLGSTAP